MKLSKSIACLSLLLFVVSAGAVEVVIQNTASRDANLYSNNGSGWNYEGSVRAGSRSQHFQSDVGESWGFSDPLASEISIIKEFTARGWGDNRLVLSDRDLNQPAVPQVHQRSIVVTNHSSREVTVYTNHAGGWRIEGTIEARTGSKFPVNNGEIWGIDDPLRSGMNLVKQTNIKAYDPFPGMTISDRELGITQPIIPSATPPNKPAAMADVSITFDNKSIHKGNIFKKNGLFSKSLLGTVGSWGSKTFTLTPGDNIVISRPGSLKAIQFRVPSSSQTFSFKPRG